MTDTYKVVRTDNFNRDEVPDKLIADGLSLADAEARATALQHDELKKHGDRFGPHWYVVVPQDYRLKRGMEDLV